MIAGQTLPEQKDRDAPTAAMPQVLPAVRAGSPAIGSRSEVLVNCPNGVANGHGKLNHGEVHCLSQRSRNYGRSATSSKQDDKKAQAIAVWPWMLLRRRLIRFLYVL